MSNSLSQTASLTCPQCQQPFDAAVWLVVDVGEEPTLLDRLRAGTLHDLPCPHCDHVAQVDVPLLLYRPHETPTLILSPAQQTSPEEDQEQTAGLIGYLQEQLGTAWQDGWLEELSFTPRPIVPTLLGDNPPAAAQQMAEELAQALEQLRRENPQAYAELEAAARHLADVEDVAVPPLLSTLQQFIEADTWMASYRFAQAHPELLEDEALTLLETLVQAAQQAGDDNARQRFAEHLALLHRCREAGVTEAFAEKMEVLPEELDIADQTKLSRCPRPCVR